MRLRVIGGLLLATVSHLALAQEGDELKARFEVLYAKGEVAGAVQLWRDNSDRTLYLIDSYLEGSLKIYEESDAPDLARIRGMHDRALFGARAADEAFLTPIFSDYASAFVGWTAEQKKRFREGQEAFGEARKALGAKDYSRALEAGQECLVRARSLGDWWGAAMGYTAVAAAEEGRGKVESALTAYTSARLIYNDLRLSGSEYRCVLSMASLLQKLERYPRALVTVDHGLILAEKRGDVAGQRKLLRLRVSVLEALGKSSAATQKRLQELPKEEAKKSGTSKG